MHGIDLIGRNEDRFGLNCYVQEFVSIKMDLWLGNIGHLDQVNEKP